VEFAVIEVQEVDVGEAFMTILSDEGAYVRA